MHFQWIAGYFFLLSLTVYIPPSQLWGAIDKSCNPLRPDKYRHMQGDCRTNGYLNHNNKIINSNLIQSSGLTPLLFLMYSCPQPFPYPCSSDSTNCSLFSVNNYLWPLIPNSAALSDLSLTVSVPLPTDFLNKWHLRHEASFHQLLLLSQLQKPFQRKESLLLPRLW